METEDIKTIFLCIDTIEQSREVLNDTIEKIENFYFDDLSEAVRFDIHGLDIVCERIKKALECASNNTENMKEQITAADEQEIEDSVLLIEGIITDNIPPKIKPIPSQPAKTNLQEVAKSILGLDTTPLNEVS